MVDIKLVEYLKHLGWSLNYIKSFNCDWEVMGKGSACHSILKDTDGNVVMENGKPREVCDVRGAICNSCWARQFAEQELAEVEKMLKQLGAEVPDWNKIPNKG
jgi:hypothetical protein